jgi:hypothetical protein
VCDKVRAKQIEAEMRHLVRVRPGLGLHGESANQVETHSGSSLHPPRAQILAGHERSSQTVSIDKLFIQLIVKRVRNGGRTSTDAENHPCGSSTRKRREVAGRAADESVQPGVPWLGWRLWLRSVGPQCEEPVVDQCRIRLARGRLTERDCGKKANERQRKR